MLLLVFTEWREEDGNLTLCNMRNDVFMEEMGRKEKKKIKKSMRLKSLFMQLYSMVLSIYSYIFIYVIKKTTQS